VATTDRPIKLTVSLDDRELYRALRHAAVERDQPLREIVIQALRDWLAKYEDEPDAEAVAETEGEESIPWDQVRQEMRQARAELRAT
jgi:hypothetical protein